MTKVADTMMPALPCGDAGHDPIEDRLRQNIRATIEALFEEELAAFIGRCRHDRGAGLTKFCRRGQRNRQLTGTFGTRPSGAAGPDRGRGGQGHRVAVEGTAALEHFAVKWTHLTPVTMRQNNRLGG